jgi:hypothetical protein
MMLIFQAHSRQGDQMIGKTRHSKDMTFDCFVFFYMSLHMCCIMPQPPNLLKFHPPTHKIFNLKEMIKSSKLVNPFSEC